MTIEIYENPNHQVIAQWLQQECEKDEFLKVAVEEANTTMNDVWNHVVEEAKQKQVNGCACLTDAEVFQHVKNFFVDKLWNKPQENIKAKEERPTQAKFEAQNQETDETEEDVVEQPKPKKEEKPKAKYEYLSLFDINEM